MSLNYVGTKQSAQVVMGMQSNVDYIRLLYFVVAFSVTTSTAFAAQYLFEDSFHVSPSGYQAHIQDDASSSVLLLRCDHLFQETTCKYVGFSNADVLLLRNLLNA
jgi:hypothetical protein